MHSYIFKLLPVACAAAILAACGGGGSTTTAIPGAAPEQGAQPAPELPPVPFASPAMIVPPGEASKTIALTNCSNGLQTASFVVNSGGDMILNGAPFGTTTISELNRINYATAAYQNVYGVNGANGPGTYIEMNHASEYIYAGTDSSSPYFFSQKTTNNTTQFYECDLTNGTTSFVLTTLPSSARLASQMLTGITGITTTQVVSSSFTGGVAYWDNWPLSYVPNPSQDEQSIRHYSLNMSTGAFGTSPTPNVAGTVYNITLPTTPTSTAANFSETNNNGRKEFFMSVDTPSAGRLNLEISRIGNLLNLTACPNMYCD